MKFRKIREQLQLDPIVYAKILMDIKDVKKYQVASGLSVSRFVNDFLHHYYFGKDPLAIGDQLKLLKQAAKLESAAYDEAGGMVKRTLRLKSFLD